jgi:hypothetical protein
MFPQEAPAPTGLVSDAAVEALAAPSGTQPPPWWSGDDTNRPNWSRRDATPEERQAWQERMATQMQARAERQRSNFFERAKLDESQTARFDVLVTAMNMRLHDRLQEWKSFAEQTDMPRPELRARVMKDINSVFVLTYDELDRAMPKGWREVSDEDFNLYTFTDPTLWRELRPFIGRGGWRGGGMGGGTNNQPASQRPQR